MTLFFPDPSSADDSGLVTTSDRLSVELLCEAYQRGIFPWSEDPVRWYSPEHRAIFLFDCIRLPKKIAKTMRRQGFRVTFDTAFRDVVEMCSDTHRHEGEWISEGFVIAYSRLHEMGLAHSVEVWQDGVLVGGLYGVQIGAMFAGESMFYKVSNASKVAFVYLVAHLQDIGVLFIDAQVLNETTADLGAVVVHRRDFLRILDYALGVPAEYGDRKWPSVPLAEVKGICAVKS